MPNKSLSSARPRRVRVFLCHSSADKSQVRNLFKRLRSDRFDPWLDEEKLLPGQDWRQVIAKVIRESDVVIVCLSQNATTKEGFVQTEIKMALDVADEKPEGTIFMIPLLLESCDVPERLSKWHRVNLFGDKGYSKLLQALRSRARTRAPSTADIELRSGQEPRISMKDEPLEYLIVEFPDTRDVFMDDGDSAVASTNKMFEVEEGTHYFNLGQPPDYRPATDWASVTGTNRATPMKIVFTKMS
jgi:hypothetical protein